MRKSLAIAPALGRAFAPSGRISSVVERILGKAEVGSSILPYGTTKARSLRFGPSPFLFIAYFCSPHCNVQKPPTKRADLLFALAHWNAGFQRIENGKDVNASDRMRAQLFQP